MRPKKHENDRRFRLDKLSEVFREIEIPTPSGLFQLTKFSKSDIKRILPPIPRETGWTPDLIAGHVISVLSEPTPQHQVWLTKYAGIDPRDLKTICAGRSHATRYRDTIIKLTEGIFADDLCDTRVERAASDGREMIDVTFRNCAAEGFFVSDKKTRSPPLLCDLVPIECKNYTDDVGPAEFQQLASRLSPHRRMTLGFLACRQVQDITRAFNYCHDHLNDGKYIICLTDDDYVKLWGHRCRDDLDAIDSFLYGKIESLLLNSKR